MAEKTIRCAIYTRKSSDEGLDQSFNSLDAQREACAAYILSQRHEGWSLNPELYDDGGYSGGNMERPGLQALMADVRAGHVDVIVVYKVDRLTRSLADFAKMVEVFDAANVSFVSITQAFNTTTSMGRLTLNVLLSFAQFEREVTGERIRDKIAASKKKGIWMGGVVPLGYDVRDRLLHINEAEAQTVRHIYKRYVELKSVPDLEAEMGAQGYLTKPLKLSNGGTRGGMPFSRGGLYCILRNPLYIGRLKHRDQVHEGLHDPIIDREEWEWAQQLLGDNARERPNGTTRGQGHLLSKRIEDDCGRRMYCAHATKGAVRYRYYLTHPKKLTKDGPPTVRVPAHEMELLVTEQLTKFFSGRSAMMTAACNANAEVLQELFNKAADAVQRLLGNQSAARQVLDDWDVHIVVARTSFEVTLQLTERILHTLTCRFDKVRRGVDVKLQAPPAGGDAVERDEQSVATLAEAYMLRQQAVAHPEMELETLAAERGMGVRRLKRLVKLSYLEPEIFGGVLEGRLTGQDIVWDA